MTSERAAATDGSPAESGLLTPFWIDDGLRVLAVGAGPDGLVGGLARRGAAVTVLESDEGIARRLGRRSVDLKRVTVVQSRISDLRSVATTNDASFDVIVHVPAPGADDAMPGTVEDVIAGAAELLRVSGTLVMAVPNPWGLRRLLEGDRPGTGVGPLALRASLAASGFREQRWLIPYPDVASPEVIVDTRLLGSDEGAGLAATFVRTPVGEAISTTLLADPHAAFRTAAEAGLAASVADWYVVVAMRSGATDAAIVREGLLFVAPDPTRGPAWADARELAPIGGRWLLHPTETWAPLTSGPFSLEPLTVAIPAGVSGEDILVDALAHGHTSAEAREALEAWWQAARVAVASSEGDHRALGVLPRDFVVGPDGAWTPIAADLTLRFPMPIETLALRAIGRTLLDAVLPRGWVPGLAPTMSVADGARAILGAIGVRVLEEHVYLWQELEVDLAFRTGRPGTTRAEHRQRIRALTATPLGTRYASLPAATLIAAGLAAPDLAAEAGLLRARLAAVTAELEASSQPPDRPSEDGVHG